MAMISSCATSFCPSLSGWARSAVLASRALSTADRKLAKSVERDGGVVAACVAHPTPCPQTPSMLCCISSRARPQSEPSPAVEDAADEGAGEEGHESDEWAEWSGKSGGADESELDPA